MISMSSDMFTFLFFNSSFHCAPVSTHSLTFPQERGGAAADPESQDKVKALRDQVDGVKDIMTQNVDRILARGERLDDLMDKSEDLQAGVSLTTGGCVLLTVCESRLSCGLIFSVSRME